MFREPRGPVTGNSSKLAVLAYSAEFCKILLTDFGSAAIRTFWEHRGPVMGTRQNSQFWSIVASFVCYYSLILGPAVNQTFREPRGPITWNSLKLTVLAYSPQFCMLLVTDFGSRCDLNVSGTSRSGYGELEKKSQFCPIVASFVCYYSLILGPAAIRMFQEPRGPVTWNSSKHAVLGYSAEFCKLLLNDFGSRCDPNILGTPGSG